MVGTAPAYLNSISPPDDRSTLSTFFELFISLGVLLTLLIMLPIDGVARLWWVSLLYCTAVTAAIPVLAYLVRPVAQPNGQHDPMQIDLLSLEGGPDVPVDDLIAEAGAAGRGGGRDIFRSPERRDSLIIAILIGFGTQITGISVFTVYITRIFEKIFATQSQFRSSMYGGLVMATFKVLGCIIPLFLIKRLKRKFMMLFGMFGSALGNVLMCITFLFQNTAKLVLTVVATALYMLMFEFGPGMITYILYSEVFPKEIQNRLVGIAFMTMALTNIVVTFTFPFFETVQWLAYGLYAVCTMGSGVALYKFLPNK